MGTQSKYLLDTCVCIGLIKKQPEIIQHLHEVGISNCFISELTLAELFFGAYKSGRKSHFNDVEFIRELFEVRAISNSLRTYGDIRWQLENRGMKLDSMDLLIGATALQEDLILVTGNLRHFERIPALRMENWMSS